MKKLIGICLVAAILFNSGCGVILGGKIDECQTVKGKSGTPTRVIRPWAMIGDIFIGGFIINLAVDFATGAIYKPCSGYSGSGQQHAKN